MPKDIETILHEIAALCATFQSVKAVGLIGSRASSDLEGSDDWDLWAFTSSAEQPTEEERRRIWLSDGSPVASATIHCAGMSDRFVIEGIHVGVDFNPPIATIDERLDRVIKKGDVSRLPSSFPNPIHWFALGECPEAICADLRMCTPLWDPDHLIMQWQNSLASYPKQFKLNILAHVLFEARRRLIDMRRASEIGDVALFHMALSELCFCLFRILFAINEEYFRGAKWAMQTVSSFRLVPDNWTEEMEDLLRGGLSVQRLQEIFLQAKSLTLGIVELASTQGEEEREAIQSGLWDWPDVDPLE